MKKKLRFIFFIALFTGAGIIAFQLYWLRNVYRVNEDNFTKTASLFLQKSIDEYLLRESKIPVAINKVSYVSFALKDAVPSADSISRSAEIMQEKNKKIVPVEVTDDRKFDIQKMMAMLANQAADKPVQLDSLKNIYAALLKRNHINLPFQLSVLQGSSNSLPSDAVSGYISFAKSGNIVVATFSNRSNYLFMQSAFSIFISLFLMLLTACSLWYMWRIIRQQKQLDEMKNDFINNITHELKTPLSILKSTNEALYSFGQAEDKEKTLRYLRLNKTEIDKLENNVERMLNITQIENGGRAIHLENTELKILAEAAINRFLTDKLNHKISFQYNLQNKEIITDGYAIDAIISNLVDNALKYTRAENKKIDISINSLDGGWELQVKDNGIGISKKQLPFIFDKFYRVPSGNVHNIKGYGLGLSYVKELVTTLEGSIKVKSKTGEGSMFIIQFPFLCKR